MIFAIVGIILLTFCIGIIYNKYDYKTLNDNESEKPSSKFIPKIFVSKEDTENENF